MRYNPRYNPAHPPYHEPRPNPPRVDGGEMADELRLRVIRAMYAIHTMYNDAMGIIPSLKGEVDPDELRMHRDSLIPYNPEGLMYTFEYSARDLLEPAITPQEYSHVGGYVEALERSVSDLRELVTKIRRRASYAARPR